ncbi:MAG: hypothetical protein ACRDU8_09190, partial [Egibacteraceae bacterium]
SHVVVEEIVEAVVGLTVSVWPVADTRGRLRFPRLNERREVGLALAVLHDELYRGWLARLPRVGDVFATELSDGATRWLVDHPDAVWRRPVAELVAGPVYDVTAEARTAAKLAFHAAVGDVVPPPAAQAWGLPTEIEGSGAPDPWRLAAGEQGSGG